MKEDPLYKLLETLSTPIKMQKDCRLKTGLEQFQSPRAKLDRLSGQCDHAEETMSDRAAKESNILADLLRQRGNEGVTPARLERRIEIQSARTEAWKAAADMLAEIKF